MATHPRVPDALRQAVRTRANHLCEYCHAAEAWQYVEFTMEHLIPLAAGGATSFDNLALACFACNRRKWHQRSAVDPDTGAVTRIFNPRVDTWNEHFAWSVDGLEVIGLTAIGRATVARLEFNRERVKPIRATDILVGHHPPPQDRRESS
jgi:hypothetical protein